jgi:hypothetical protein
MLKLYSLSGDTDCNSILFPAKRRSGLKTVPSFMQQLDVAEVVDCSQCWVSMRVSLHCIEVELQIGNLATAVPGPGNLA